MSNAWDALPAIVPFFGALTVSLCCGIGCLNRRLNRLQHRLALLEQMRPPPAPSAPVLPIPPPSAPPVYPMQPPPSWPPYRAYISNTI